MTTIFFVKKDNDPTINQQMIYVPSAGLTSIPNNVSYIKGPTGGSMVFTNSPSNTYVQFANDSNLAIGTSAFTVEWFQYWTGSEANPRPFSIGTWSGATFAVSYESNLFYVWVNATGTTIGSAPPKNTWVHIALVGSGTNIKVYTNGNLTGTVTGSYNMSNTTTALCIGNETSPSSASCLKGNITNFRWVKGTQVYTSNFTKPSAPLTAIGGTELLLLATNSGGVVVDSGPRNRTPTNTGVVFSATTPF